MAQLITIRALLCRKCERSATRVLIDDDDKMVGRFCKEHGEEAYMDLPSGED